MKNTHTIDSADLLSAGSLTISRYGCRKNIADQLSNHMPVAVKEKEEHIVKPVPVMV